VDILSGCVAIQLQLKNISESRPMHIDLVNLLYYLALGVTAGFLSGLIGIGGGFVLVPGLYYVFSHGGLAPGHEMPLALGTTMAAILFSSASSVRSHWRLGAIQFPLVKRFTPWVAAGTMVGAALVSQLDTNLVKAFFAAFCLYSAARMLFASNAVTDTGTPLEETALAAPGFFFGAVCGLIGGGGAILFVPFMLKHKLGIREAVATASSLQIPIAIIGALSYIVLGLQVSQPAGALGFVYLPALALMTTVSMFAAPVGVRYSRRLPVGTLKKMFGLIAAVVGLKLAGAFAFVFNFFHAYA
jgi:uncharacterized membrane protein YfcA